MDKLTLEINEKFVTEKLDIASGHKKDENVIALPSGAKVFAFPHGGAGNWAFRVMVSRTQAIIGFSKFFTIGIGFMNETDWNTNLPCSCDAMEILDHIRVNKGEHISDQRCLEAIELVREAGAKWLAYQKSQKN